jgi:hypothetical protein
MLILADVLSTVAEYWEIPDVEDAPLPRELVAQLDRALGEWLPGVLTTDNDTSASQAGALKQAVMQVLGQWGDWRTVPQQNW